MGEEAYYIDKIMEALEQEVVAEEDKEFDQTILFGADTNAGMVMEAAGRFPMMSPRQLVMLKEAQGMFQAKNSLDKLKPYISNPNPNTVLAISFKGDVLNKTSELMKAVKKNSAVIVFESPMVKEYRLPPVIKDYCSAKKISIEDKAVELLISNVGTSLTSLFSEIEKLRVVQKGDDKRITADMVYDHIGVSREFNNFELVAAIASRNYFQSMRIIRHFENNPKANPTVLTTGQLFTFFQRMVLATFSADKSDNALLKALNLKGSWQLKDIRTGLMHYNASQAVNAIHAIRRFDTKSKGVDSFQKEYPLLMELVFTLLTL